MLAGFGDGSIRLYDRRAWATGADGKAMLGAFVEHSSWVRRPDDTL